MTDVALIVPTLNEAAHIGRLLEVLRRQMQKRVSQILVVDGGSSDATCDLVRSAIAEDPRIRLVANPRKLQAAGVNLAADQLGPGVRIMIRVDAHTDYPTDFVQTLVDAYDATGAQSVVNRLRSVGTGCFQRSVAAVSNSRLGTGGSLHRVGGASAYVDHGHHALFDLQWFKRLRYDEQFFANEDAEYDVRLRSAGGRIWFCAESVIEYSPRSTPSGLATQYFRYGRGRAMTIRKHGERPRLRQLAPPLLLCLVAGGLALWPWIPIALALPALYALGIICAAGSILGRTRDSCSLGTVLALPIIHLAWGAGFLIQIVRPQPAAMRPASSVKLKARVGAVEVES